MNMRFVNATLTLVCLAVLSVLCVSCGDFGGFTYGSGQQREPVVVDHGPRHEPPPVIREPVHEREWRLIARREVGYAVDKDRFNVEDKGRFSELKILVEGRPIEVYGMEVIFSNGDRWAPPMRHRFEKNTMSHSIDLPGERRAIDRVYFTYQTIGKKQGRAVLALYGR